MKDEKEPGLLRDILMELRLIRIQLEHSHKQQMQQLEHTHQVIKNQDPENYRTVWKMDQQ